VRVNHVNNTKNLLIWILTSGDFCVNLYTWKEWFCSSI